MFLFSFSKSQNLILFWNTDQLKSCKINKVHGNNTKNRNREKKSLTNQTNAVKKYARFFSPKPPKLNEETKKRENKTLVQSHDFDQNSTLAGPSVIAKSTSTGECCGPAMHTTYGASVHKIYLRIHMPCVIKVLVSRKCLHQACLTVHHYRTHLALGFCGVVGAVL